ncbi:hypothetical protein D046_1512A, partial [Vibrio parahaemolyticus V-223/04]
MKWSHQNKFIIWSDELVRLD